MAWPQSSGSRIEVSADVADRVIALKDLKATIKELEKREEALNNAILPHFMDAKTMTYQGKILSTWKSQDARRLDQKAITAAYPDLIEQFKVTSSTRVLRLK